MVYVLMEC